jgi:hypothetical protein
MGTSLNKDNPMELLIDISGVCRCIYSEEITLTQLGTVDIRRASHVEPRNDNSWYADLSPVGGPMLGPFDRRSDALDAERRWLECWLSNLNSPSEQIPSFSGVV